MKNISDKTEECLQKNPILVLVVIMLVGSFIFGWICWESKCWEKGKFKTETKCEEPGGFNGWFLNHLFGNN